MFDSARKPTSNLPFPGMFTSFDTSPVQYINTKDLSLGK